MPAIPPNGSNLCLPCGLCCDGSLFERARLGPDEQDLAMALGLTLAAEKHYFHQPCPIFQGNCTIYGQTHPTVCGSFKCKLLRKYENSKIDLSDALGLIERVRAMQTELALISTILKKIPSLAEVKRQMSSLSRASVKQRRDQLEFLLLAAKYEMFLRTHFLIGPHKKGKTDKLPAMGEND